MTNSLKVRPFELIETREDPSDDNFAFAVQFKDSEGDWVSENYFAKYKAVDAIQACNANNRTFGDWHSRIAIVPNRFNF